MSLVKMIKPDAIVSIEIGAIFMQKIQKLLLYLVNDISQEKLQKYKELIEKNETFTEDWMEHITTISILLKEIETKAIEQNLAFDKDINDILTSENN